MITGTPTTPKDLSWKTLATDISRNHHDAGGSVTFVFSGASMHLVYGGKLEVEPDLETMQSVDGTDLTPKFIRSFMWERRPRRDWKFPSEAPRTMVVWTAHEPEQNKSFMGFGRVVRARREVA